MGLEISEGLRDVNALLEEMNESGLWDLQSRVVGHIRRSSACDWIEVFQY